MRISLFPYLQLFLFLHAIVRVQGNVKVVALNEQPLSFLNLHDEGDPSYVIGISETGPPIDVVGRPMAITANGTKYTCYLPNPARNEILDSTSPLSADPAAAAFVKEKTPEEIMDEQGDFCAYRIEDWWTYEVCYKKAARQYHSEGNAVLDQYHLGNYSAADSDMLVPTIDSEVAGEMHYVRQAYLGGAPCELTGRNRSVEVRYVCGRGSQTVLTDVREPKSCAYIFTITTPRLCKHSAFQDRIPMAVPIVCYPQLNASCSGGSGGSGECTNGGSAAGSVVARAIPLLSTGEDDEVGAVDGSKSGTSTSNSTSTAVLDEDGDEGKEEKVDGVGLGDVFNGGGHDEEYEY